MGTFVMLNLVIAVIIDNFIESAQSEGLLKTNNFVDLLRLVITLKVCGQRAPLPACLLFLVPGVFS